MNSNEILKANLLDILFDNRNKQYGAYTLRKYYGQRLGSALGISLGLAFLLVLIIRPRNSAETIATTNDPGVIVKQVAIPKDKLPEIPKPKPAAAAPKTVQLAITKPVIMDDIKVHNPMEDQKTLLNSALSAKTVIGDPGDPYIVPVDPGPVSGGGEKKADPPATPPADAPVQKEPEFPGGTKAWLDFLNRNLIVPEDLEAGEKKMVQIRFQVAADGRVTGFEVLLSGGSSYDNEVIRVLKRMPKWKPAIQNGIPVARSFTQPVTFVGLE